MGVSNRTVFNLGTSYLPTYLGSAVAKLLFCSTLSSRLPPHFYVRHTRSFFQVGCDASCLRVVSVLLRDLLATDSMAYRHAHVVLVIPQEPTLAWEALLCLQPSFAVTYLNGDLRCVLLFSPR